MKAPPKLLSATCAELGITLHAESTSFFLSPLAPTSDTFTRLVESSRMCDAVDEVLDFARGRTAVMRRDADCEGAAEVMRLTERLKALLMAWED